MAPLLRASFHGLRCSRFVPSPSLSSQRELLKPPESNYILWRRYGESAALEVTCSSSQTVNDTAGESRAAIQGEDSSKLVDAQQSLNEIPTTNAAKQERAAKEPSSALSSDKLTSSILAKLRKNNPNGPKDNGVPLKGESMSSMANKLPEGSSQKIAEDKWNQVKISLRNMAAKKKGNLASGGAMPNSAKKEQDENQDDFADLDLPQAGKAAAPSKVSGNSEIPAVPAVDMLRNSPLNLMPKEGEMQGLNAKQKAHGFQGNQQKAKEAKPFSFSFLKSLDDTASTSGMAEDGSSNATSKVKSALQGLLSKTSNSYKSVQQAKNDPPHEAKSASSNEVKSDFFRESNFHELRRSLTEEQEKASSIANGVTNGSNRTINRGYTVCIRNLPSQSNLALVKDAVSLHGEVISSFKKSNSDGSCNAFIEFKTAEAMDGALASRWLSLDSKAFSIVRADAPITTVVRLSTVSAETADSHLASICEQFGSLDYIKKRGNGVFDVYYKPNELSSMPTILDSLNEVTLNERRFVALPAPLLHPAMRKEVLKGSEGQAWHASQISQTLGRIETGLDIVSVCFEDLKSLTAMEDEIVK